MAEFLCAQYGVKGARGIFQEHESEVEKAAKNILFLQLVDNI